MSSGVCKEQSHRPACPSTQTDQHICYSLFRSIISELASDKISIFQLVSVADETGLSLTLPETPKTGFVTMRPIYSCTQFLETYHSFKTNAPKSKESVPTELNSRLSTPIEKGGKYLAHKLSPLH